MDPQAPTPQPHPTIVSEATVVETPKPKSKLPFFLIVGALLLLGSSIFLIKYFFGVKTPLEMTIPDDDPTISTIKWNTYKNDQYGFEVKYNPSVTPNEINSVQQLALIGFGSLKNNGFDIEVTTGDSLEYYKNQVTDHISSRIDKEENILVDGVAATKLTYQQVIVTDKQDVSKVIIKHNGSDYIVTALSSDIDLILSTFKFTN